MARATWVQHRLTMAEGATALSAVAGPRDVLALSHPRCPVTAPCQSQLSGRWSASRRTVISTPGLPSKSRRALPQTEGDHEPQLKGTFMRAAKAPGSLQSRSRERARLIRQDLGAGRGQIRLPWGAGQCKKNRRGAISISCPPLSLQSCWADQIAHTGSARWHRPLRSAAIPVPPRRPAGPSPSPKRHSVRTPSRSSAPGHAQWRRHSPGQASLFRQDPARWE